MIKNYTDANPKTVLKEVFGYDDFRFLQEEIIKNVLNKKDTLAIMPTGGGKSICYQIPALIFDGITIVVSPLISLMQDQVDSLLADGVSAVFLNSSLSWDSYLTSINAIRKGEIKIVYVSPEGLNSQRIKDLFFDSGIKVSCVTIDEAHCVSEWGHDFRPDYLEIQFIRKHLKNTVFLALTATATAQVQKDIIENLSLNNPKILISSFNRENIFLKVVQKNNPFEQIVDCIKRHWDESGIIYCFSRKQVDSLTLTLQEKGYSALNYHAGLSDQDRMKHQNMFIKDQVQIMVATLAFGMGIDKPNVRFVIHYDLPKSLEQYYQEIGRAGRDGLPSEALLLYSFSDIQKIRFFFEESFDRNKAESLLQGIINYASSYECRRKTLLNYFGENNGFKNNSEYCCDVCSSENEELFDLTISCQKLMSCIIRTNSRFGTQYIIDVLLGSRNKRIIENNHNMISTWGIGCDLTRGQWMAIVDMLLCKNFLVKTVDYGILNLTKKGLHVLRNRDKILLPFDINKSKSNKTDNEKSFVPNNRAASGANGGLLFPKPIKKKVTTNFILHKKDNLLRKTDYVDEFIDLRKKIKKWRKSKAEENNVPPYIIMGDRTIEDLLIKQPRTKEELLNVYGIGNNKIEKYGVDILNILNDNKHI